MVTRLACLALLLAHALWAEEPVSFTQSVNKREAYVGEQILHTIELCSKVTLERPTLSDFSYVDFWVQPLGDKTGERAAEEGRCKYSLSQRVLFPLRAGSLRIPSRTVTVRMLVTRPAEFPLGGSNPFANDLWSALFGARVLEDRQFESEPLEISAKPLPPAPAEAALWGLSQPLVGPTQVKIKAPATTLVHTGEPQTVSVEVVSLGNLSSLQTLPFHGDPRLRVYPEAASISVSADTGIAVSRKLLRATIVPMEAGELAIPELKLPYFDPAAGSYLTATASGFRLHVLSSNVVPQEPLPEISAAPRRPWQAQNASYLSFSLLCAVLLALVLRELVALAARHARLGKELGALEAAASLSQIEARIRSQKRGFPSLTYLTERLRDEARLPAHGGSDERLRWFKSKLRRFVS